MGHTRGRPCTENAGPAGRGLGLAQSTRQHMGRPQSICVDVGTRWRQLADIAEKRVDDHVFGFTDTHFMMALARDGRQSAAGALLESLRRFASVTDANSARSVASRVTIPVCEAIGAYADKHFDHAVEVLWPLRAQWQELGASHAQRDIFTQTLIEAAIRANRTTLARDLLAERSKLKPNSHYTWQRYADALQACGELEAARGARARAGAHTEVHTLRIDE